MGKTLLATCGQSALTTAAFSALGGRINSNGVEGNRKTKLHTAGTLTNLGVYVNGTGTGRAFNTRKNGAAGNLSPTITDSAAGAYFDDVNSDAISGSTDLWNYQNANPGGATFYWSSVAFAATSGHTAYYMTSGNGDFPSVGDAFHAISGYGFSSTVEAQRQVTVRTAGTLDWIGVQVSNSWSAAATVTSRKNGANGGISFTVSASSGSGFVESSSGSDSLSSGDIICLDYNPAAGSGTILIYEIISEITATSGQASDYFMVYGASNVRAASATVHYLAPVGQINSLVNTSETEVRVRPGFACKITNFRCRAQTANTYSASCTVTMRKNGVDVITLTIGAGVTTEVEDAVTQISLSASDDFSISITGGSSGSLTMDYFAYVIDSAPSFVPHTLIPQLGPILAQ